MRIFAASLAAGFGLIGAIQGAHASPVEVKVNLKLEGKDSACVIKRDAQPKRVYRSKRDVLVWTISNSCEASQAVRVCVRQGAKEKSPLHKCNGDPDAGDIGAAAMVPGRVSPNRPSYATITCHVKWDVLDPGETKKAYRIDVISAPAISDLDCPCTKPGEMCHEDYEIALDVLP